MAVDSPRGSASTAIYVLDLVEWVADCAKNQYADLDDVVDELSSLRIEEGQRLAELFHICVG